MQDLHLWCRECQRPRAFHMFDVPDNGDEASNTESGTENDETSEACQICRSKKSAMNTVSAESNAKVAQQLLGPHTPIAVKELADALSDVETVYVLHFQRTNAYPISRRNGRILSPLYARAQQADPTAVTALVTSTHRPCWHCGTIRRVDEFLDEVGGITLIMEQCSTTARCLLRIRPEIEVAHCRMPMLNGAEPCDTCCCSFDRGITTQVYGVRSRAVSQGDEDLPGQTVKRHISLLCDVFRAFGKAQRWRCAMCAVVFSELIGEPKMGPGAISQASLDRVVPGCRDGRYVVRNLQLLCFGCQFGKGKLSAEQYAIIIQALRGRFKGPTDVELRRWSSQQHNSIIQCIKKSGQEHKMGDLLNTDGADKLRQLWTKQGVL